MSQKFEANTAEKLRVATDECLDLLPGRGLGDEIGDVDGVEIAGREVAVYRLQGDVVGVAEVGKLPAEGGDGLVGGAAHRARLRTDDQVFAVRLVPDGNDLNALGERLAAGFELGLGLVGEAVAGSDR